MLQTIQKDSVEANALIALGSNVNSIWGNPKLTIQKAILEVELLLGGQAETSRYFATPAFPAGAGPDFVNAAIRVTTTCDAQQILEILKRAKEQGVLKEKLLN